LNFYSESSESVIKHLSADAKNGLASSQVQERIEQYGENRLKEAKKKSNFQRFIAQFKDAMILILIAAAAVSFAIAVIEGHPKEFFEPSLILLIVILNAILGMMQESKAEKALEALKNMSAPHAKVLRNGQESVIEAYELVPGDIIRLEAGDSVPADARLLRSSSLKSEESALTGESVPSEKNADDAVDEKAAIGDRHNMIFSGCSITYGAATAVVTATGMDTEMGRIAGLLDAETNAQTPLQKKLAQLGKYLGLVALAACAVIFAVGLINGIDPMEMFMTAVSLAVSAIPEGLPAVVTIVLSIGVQRMVKKNAIIRSLPAVETLGSASVICSDKTGTLTQNRMTLVKTYTDGAADAEDMHKLSDKALSLLKYAALCCDGSVNFENGGEQHIGDPTETAIVLAAHKNGMPKDAINAECPREADIPFDSDRKLMTTINRIDGVYIAIVKGAPDILAERCVKGETALAMQANDKMAKSALRVLAIGWRDLGDMLPADISPQNIEKELTFMGLVGMIDPPRPEVKAAVDICRKAGIKPVMITGDHVVTASAIAQELGMMSAGDKSITGTELDTMSEELLDAEVENISVYARVSPENKIRIVKAWQKKERVVAMTGDGVNDAPALKAADIGCAMGITGTDVAKGAADMTLTDDNFATIVDAVREGRGIYANIKKVVGFLLGTNIGEVITIFAAMLIWHIPALLSMQLLWINLVTDSLPAIALGTEAVENDIMGHKPKPKNEGIFAGGLGLRVLLQGCMFAALTLIGLRVGMAATGSLEGGQTLAFMILALTQLVQAYNMRSEHSLFDIGFFTNRNLNCAATLSVLLVALVMLTPVNVAFGMIYLPFKLYMIGLGLAFVPLFVMEIAKKIKVLKK